MGRALKHSKINVINCATEELFLSVAEAQEADVNRAVAAARAAFDHGPWPLMSHAERAGYLKASPVNSSFAARLGKDWVTESGVTSNLAQMVSGSILAGIYEYYAGLADTFPFEERRTPSPEWVTLDYSCANP